MSSRGARPSGEPGEGSPTVVFRWDLDKTYLRTKFESLRKLVLIPFEAATEKVHLPGVPQLMGGLRRSALARGDRPFVFFLSASPPQIGAEIRKKLALDGIEYDGIIFKDQLRNLVRGRFRSMREQVGYKLGELLRGRRDGPRAREVLFGDDWESDPVIYSLYADVLAGRLGGDRLAGLLGRLDVDRDSIRRIDGLARTLAGDGPADDVLRIYINLERRTPPGRFRAFGPRLVPAFNYFQTALSLYEVGVLDAVGLGEVARALHERGWGGERLRNSLDDLVRRGHLGAETADRAILVLHRDGQDLQSASERTLGARAVAAMLRLRRRMARSQPEPGPVEPIDWEALVEHWVAHRAG
ncbi:MAG: phosphatase domain-containing protein [Alphaproteobacteria bacterium]